MEITNISWGDERWPNEGDYSVQMVTDQGDDVSARQRTFTGFPRLRYNVWALIMRALLTLGDEEFEYKGSKHVLGGTPNGETF